MKELIIGDQFDKQIKLRDELLAIEKERLEGVKYYSVDEVVSLMRAAVKDERNNRLNEKGKISP